MSTPNYYSQMAPFWNWVAKVEQKGPSHPWFERRAKRAANRGETLNTGADGMAHFWEFVSKVEEQGPSHPWIKRRAAMQAKRNAKGGESNEKSGSAPAADAEAPKPGRNGPWGRPRRQQQVAKAEQTAPVSSDSEKEFDEKTFDQLVSEAEKVEVGNETRRGPGARGGRSGRGGKGRGLGKGRQAAVAAEGLKEADAAAPVQSADETTRGPGARRGGRGFGRGAGLGAGQGMAFHRIMALRPHAHHAMLAAPWLNTHHPGHQHGPGGARNFAMGGPHAHGPHGGPRGRGGRGMGAGRGRGMAGFGRGGHANFFQGPFRPAAWPQSGPARAKAQGANAQAGPKRGPQARRFGPMRGGRKTPHGAFIPLVDVFDHPESFMIHASLPGAKKEAIEVNWDAERSVLSITGQMERPGDEDLHKTLALNERKVGAFKRNIRLGGKAHPAQVVVEDITARMEDGVLRVKVPKLDAGFVEVRKVDIL